MSCGRLYDEINNTLACRWWVRKYENESETAVSESKTPVSESETTVSESETAVLDSETAVLESETAVSETYHIGEISYEAVVKIPPEKRTPVIGVKIFRRFEIFIESENVLDVQTCE